MGYCPLFSGAKSGYSPRFFRGDPSGMLGLGRWFERMPTDAWKKTLQAIAESDETIARLRMYTRTGRPLGDESFLKRIEEAIERAIRAKSVGRPKGSKDKVKRGSS